MSKTNAPLAGVRLCQAALPETLFQKVEDAVRSAFREKVRGKSSYSTTFWYPRGAAPANVAEEAIAVLMEQVALPQDCIGTEWWLGRLGYRKKLNFHFDRDLVRSRETGESIFPLLGSVFYLNDYPSSPTVLTDQVPGPDGKSKQPADPNLTLSVAAIRNNYVVFPGNLYHGVVPDPSIPHPDGKTAEEPAEKRLTLLVNYWHRRPSAPICQDFDGSVYPSLRLPVAA
ncbi:hypothetical protein [Roseibium sp. MMSF_3412]|uniref:hypothetical protein n=1 Tax=Roseibium sp. MMSF_3412 TaxID=3046712 RepID=UPI00273E9AB5|nr:hypothetical protein [Roseibium sp. MMSF_3412]